ncbi:MAG TPA: 3-deoxy-7-phosphoheptulonate synthase [Planctomycetota bacterium]|nr:3-deoxy-7-phosphoheptulonate synthase [Planctomycetota bacterium]
MIIVLARDATEADIGAVVQEAARTGAAPAVARSGDATVVRVATDGRGGVSGRLRALPKVRGVVEGDLPYVLASRDFKAEDTQVAVGDVVFGARRVVLMAGPCAVESRDQLRLVARQVKEAGARVLRGGAFKPRTSPYAFQGLGEDGLKLLAETAADFGLKVVTEVMAPEQVELVGRYADMLQIGSRSVQNFPLLRAVGRTRKPVLLKRGMATEIDEFLGAAEYVLAEGNDQVVLCERGIRTFEPRTRFTFDVSAIPLLKRLTHLPVVADPSHATGAAFLVPAASKAAIAAGADGLLIESHPDPREALSDGRQAMTPDELALLAPALRRLAEAVDRTL